ncbi:MAG TPA: hypothetical protein VH350_07495 [Candidatus Sulfotelmatobacter sp.]|nr:hypothetical protein [Candidatus Sulfotelmatobacter sp.]
MPSRGFQVSYALVVIFCLSMVSTSLVAQDMAQDAPPPQLPGNVVPQGTVFLIQLTDQLDTRTVKAGQHFEARLAEPLVTVDGQTIPMGKKIKGHVSAVEPGFRTRMILSFNEINTGHGWMPLIATVTGVPGEHGLRQIGEEGEIGRQGMTKEEIAEAIVEGAGRGAMEGEKSGGKRGAAQGAGAGAADAAATAFQSAHDLILEKGTALEIRLDRNLGIPR